MEEVLEQDRCLPFAALSEDELIAEVKDQIGYHYEDFGWGVTEVGAYVKNDVNECPVIDTEEVEGDVTGLLRWPKSASGSRRTENGDQACFSLKLERELDKDDGRKIAVYSVWQE